MVSTRLAWTCLAALWVSGAAMSSIARADAPQPPAEKTAAEGERFTGPPPIPGVEWQRGPCKGRIGPYAEVDVPAGYHFTERDGTVAYLRALGNLTGDRELACMQPDSLEWFAVFEYDAVGYVKDDEKDKIDAEALMNHFMEGNKIENETRKQRNMPFLNLVGWEVQPKYDTESNSLEWGLRLRSPDGDTVNYFTKRLGRHGVMEISLVVDPKQLNAALPKFKTVLKNYQFSSGEKYSEFREGDKIAEYGLTALVAGGALAVAAKSGLLGKLLKPLLVGAALVAGAIAKFWRNLFGRRSSEI